MIHIKGIVQSVTQFTAVTFLQLFGIETISNYCFVWNYFRGDSAPADGAGLCLRSEAVAETGDPRADVDADAADPQPVHACVRDHANPQARIRTSSAEILSLTAAAAGVALIPLARAVMIMNRHELS
jgi:hypothetical protein